MDGNNRWSKKKSINIFTGYKIGAENLIKNTKYLFDNSEIKYVSAFALSKNNLSRSSKTINTIKKVLKLYLNKIEIEKYNFNIKFIGDFNFLDNDAKDKILLTNKKKSYKKNLIIFINYGGIQDIEEAAKKYKNNNRKFSSFLSTSKIPDPDILIRTGGFNRISNFLLYQISFTEIFFQKKLWPDFKIIDLKKIINKYRIVERKFGK